jgi:hypothetical protein
MGRKINETHNLHQKKKEKIKIDVDFYLKD